MDDRTLRPAMRLAVDVARDGELADPPIRAPSRIRRLLTFHRLSASAYRAVAEALESDPDFRERVAEAADEEDVGRAGYLWLTRPEGWERNIEEAAAGGPDDPRERAAMINRLKRAREGAEAAAERATKELDESETLREELSERLSGAEARARDSQGELDAARAEMERLGEERNRAVRELKTVESELADLRHELRVARDATREAEGELAELRSRWDEDDRQVQHLTDTAPEPESAHPAEPFDRDRVRHVIDSAADAASVLARHLAEAGRVLSSGPPDDDRRSGEGTEGDSTPSRTGGPRAEAPVVEGRRGGPRRRPRLGFGVIEGTAEADRALLSDSANLLLVDGYNLARSLWSGFDPEEERRRTIAMLEELGDRSGLEIIVVFDGVDDIVAPMASRRIRVRFSPTGTTADEVILEALRTIPIDRPVVVVSSDREVADGATAKRALAMSSDAFARAVGR